MSKLFSRQAIDTDNTDIDIGGDLLMELRLFTQKKKKMDIHFNYSIVWKIIFLLTLIPSHVQILLNIEVKIHTTFWVKMINSFSKSAPKNQKRT